VLLLAAQVPYYGQIDVHAGAKFGTTAQSRTGTPHGKALLQALKGDVTMWEKTFGVAGDWWLRRGGWDHLLVYPAPLESLTQERSQRGDFWNRKQLHHAIAINDELLNRFIGKYPRCTRRMLQLPYPNDSPGWASGEYAQKATKQVRRSWAGNGGGSHRRNLDFHAWQEIEAGWNGFTSDEQLQRMLQLAGRDVLAMASMNAGARGKTCGPLRQMVVNDLVDDSCPRCAFAPLQWDGMQKSGKHWQGAASHFLNVHGQESPRREEVMHRSLFCPVPAGDSPSAKRNYDVVRAGCIPIIIAADFVYAWGEEAGMGDLREDTFALRLLPAETGFAVGGPHPAWLRQLLVGPNSSHQTPPATQRRAAEATATRRLLPHARLGELLRSIPPLRVRSLLEGLERARDAFAYWTAEDWMGTQGAERQRTPAPSMLAHEGATPTGGAAQRFLLDLERLGQHRGISECDAELQKPQVGLRNVC